MSAAQIKTITAFDKNYPLNLARVSNPPGQLFIKGNLKRCDEKAIAVVGTRNMTTYGKKTAHKFCFELAKAGLTIVSGMARGVDTVTHKAALSAGGRTIAVLGSGLDVIYPPENKKLAENIIKNGAVVSEFPLGTKPLPKNFLSRNRIISGLSKAVLVVEGAKKSGTLSTAGHAADQGREVFAIPGRVDDRMSYLPNFLIKNGANIATCPEDILDIIL